MRGGPDEIAAFEAGRARGRGTAPRFALARGPAPTRALAVALAVAVALSLAAWGALLTPAPLSAGSIWTDGDGDGLPDPHGLSGASPGDEIAVDVWIDTQSFVFTYFQAWVERDKNLRFLDAVVTLSGGAADTVDTFSNPDATGLTGAYFAPRQGVLKVGRMRYVWVDGASCAVRPLTEYGGTWGTFSVLGMGPHFFLFDASGGTSWAVFPEPARPAVDWGTTKGIAR